MSIFWRTVNFFSAKATREIFFLNNQNTSTAVEVFNLQLYNLLLNFNSRSHRGRDCDRTDKFFLYTGWPGAVDCFLERLEIFNKFLIVKGGFADCLMHVAGIIGFYVNFAA